MLEVLEREIAAHANGIGTTIANYEATSASLAWMETLRAVEELINLPIFGLR